MKHLVLERPGKLMSGSESEPEPGPEDALVMVHRVGICGTDIHAFHGRQPFFDYPRIPGHELGVEVLSAPAESGLHPGDLCAVRPYLNDPRSQASLRGKTNCCESLKVLGVHMDGGLRERIVVPAHLLHPSSSMSLDQLALVETLCIGAHATARSRVQEDDFVVIVGAGPIGLTVLEFVRQRTNRPIAVVDMNEFRLEFVKEVYGIENVLRPGDDLKRELLEAGGGDLPTILFDATGHSGSMMGAFDLVAHGGVIVFVGLFQGDVTFHDPTFHRKELTIMASRNGTARDFTTVMDSIERGLVDTTPWITHRMAIGNVPEQFERTVSQPGLLKAIIDVT